MGPRHIGAARSSDMQPEWTQWLRVSELERVSTITVTLKGGQTAKRNFVFADESELIALNLTDAALPRQVRRTLRALAADDPSKLVFTLWLGRTLTEGRVRLGRDGVFLDERRVAALEQVLETYARADVFEITGPVVAEGSAGGALLGGWIGSAVGAASTKGVGPWAIEWVAIIGAMAFGIYLGSHAGSHATEGLVYRTAG